MKRKMKLKLSKETILTLNPEQLDQAAGGWAGVTLGCATHNCGGGGGYGGGQQTGNCNQSYSGYCGRGTHPC